MLFFFIEEKEKKDWHILEYIIIWYINVSYYIIL